jgi:hypothetical protein
MANRILAWPVGCRHASPAFRSHLSHLWWIPRVSYRSLLTGETTTFYKAATATRRRGW